MRGTFFLKRALINFVRNKYNNFSSIINVAVVSFFSVLLLFIIENMIEFIDGLISENSAAIILKDSATEEDIKNMSDLLSEQKGINGYRYLSPYDAYEEVKRVFLLSSDTVELEPSQVFPHLFELRFSRTIGREDYYQFQEKLKKNVAFKEIRINSDLMELSFKIKKYSIYFKGVIFFIVCISSFYILSNTIGLNLNNNRREEIELIELLGGNYLDIKVPYIVEGMIVITLGFVCGILIAYIGALVIFPYIGKIFNTKLFSFKPIMIELSDAALVYFILVISGLMGVIRFINRFINELYEEVRL